MNKLAKKVVGVTLSLTLMLAMSVSVFAAGSPQGNGTVTGGTTSDNKAVTFNKVSDTVITNAQNNLGKAPAGMNIVDTVDVTVDGYTGGAITITFNVAGVVAGQTVGVLHSADGGTTWEYIAGTAGNGTITVTLSSLSPVAFVVGAKPAASAAKAGTTTTKVGASPKTGEFGTTSVLAIIAVLAMGGAVACYRRKEEVR